MWMSNWSRYVLRSAHALGTSAAKSGEIPGIDVVLGRSYSRRVREGVIRRPSREKPHSISLIGLMERCQ